MHTDTGTHLQCLCEEDAHGVVQEARPRCVVVPVHYYQILVASVPVIDGLTAHSGNTRENKDEYIKSSTNYIFSKVGVRVLETVREGYPRKQTFQVHSE